MFSISTLLAIIYLSSILLAVKPVIGQLKQKKIQHLVFGVAAALSILWWFRAGIYQGLDVHFLWLTAATLTLGWRWALVSSALASLVMVLMGHLEINEFGSYALLNCVLPIGFSYFAYMFAYHKLPRHFIVYIFFCSFFIGACCIALKMFANALYFQYMDLYGWQLLVDNYLVLVPLLLFPEGLLNGMTMTLLVIYKPGWVKTFFDNQYLDK